MLASKSTVERQTRERLTFETTAAQAEKHKLK